MSEDSIEVLKDIRRWLKIIGIQEAKPVISDALSDEDEDRQRDLRITYHLTDGDHSSRDIAEYIDYSNRWVARRQQEWANMGIVEKNRPNEPYQKLVGLNEVGIEEPDLPDTDGDDEDGGE